MNRELNRLIWKERAKTITAATGVLIAVIAVVMLVLSLVYPVSQNGTENVEGVVVHYTKHQSNKGPGSTILRIRLVDGKEISVTTKREHIPNIGDNIQLSEHRNMWGHIIYRLTVNLSTTNTKIVNQ